MINKFYKILLLMLLFDLGAVDIFGQNITTEWSKQIRGSFIESGSNILVSGSGNIYTTGIFTDSLFFNIAGNDGVLIVKGFQGSDSYLSKFDQNGNLIWIKQFAGNYFCEIASFALDDEENIYVTGSFSDTAWLDNNNISITLIAHGEIDAFICKINNNGDFQWAKQFGNAYRTEGRSITTDKLGNAFCTGTFRGTVDFDPNAPEYHLTSEGFTASTDIFISKLDGDGNFQFAKQFKGIWGEVPTVITTDSVYNIYIAGEFTQTVDFDPGLSSFQLEAVAGTDAFIVKLQNDGDFIWAKRFGGIGGSKISSLQTDENNIYFTGNFSGETDFDPGIDEYLLASIADSNGNDGNNVFICKLNENGDFGWAKQFATGWAGTMNLFLKSHDLFLCGRFVKTVDFDPSINVLEISPTGYVDIYVAKLDNDGGLKWVRTFGGSDIEDNGATSICVDLNDNIFITGFFEGNLDFDAVELNANLNSDIFITKFKNIPTSTDDFDYKDIFISPNPIQGKIFINSNSVKFRDVQVFNNLGQCIIIDSINNANEHIVDITGHSNGIYFIQISTDIGIKIYKILKH